MNALAGALVKFLTWLGTMFLIRKGAKDEVRRDVAEDTLETVERVTAPVAADERERLWTQNVAKFGGGVRRDPGT